MSMTFERDGIRCHYPENWQRDEQESEAGWTVSLQSPNTAFLLIAYDDSMPDREEMAQTALDALKADYADLEAEECFESIAGQPAFGYDVRFFSLDLTNTCVVRSFYSGQGTVLLLWQLSDLDMESAEPVLRAICASLQVEED